MVAEYDVGDTETQTMSGLRNQCCEIECLLVKARAHLICIIGEQPTTQNEKEREPASVLDELENKLSSLKGEAVDIVNLAVRIGKRL